MLAVMLQTYPRSTMAWVGRIAQVVGTAYMLVAALVAARSARAMGLPVEIALHEAEKRFDDLVEMAADGIVVSDPGGGGASRRIRRANPAASTLLGYSPQEMLGLSLDDLVAPAERGQLAADMATLGREGAADAREDARRARRARAARRDQRAAGPLRRPRDGRLDPPRPARAAPQRRAAGASPRRSSSTRATRSSPAHARRRRHRLESRGAAELFGYHGAAAIVGRRLATLFAPEHRDAEQPMREALAARPAVARLRDRRHAQRRHDGPRWR
ncbi:MAG: PAS domain-containing protein [Chromatiales bacterium]|nr:PAS domain-containing protein [Chromatiales bacterium]